MEIYPLPTFEDLLIKVGHSNRYFCSLDLTGAYAQLEVSEESKKFLCINTHRGLYAYKRLPYGVASAGMIFQKTIETILQGLDKTGVYIDDILTGGETFSECKDNLYKILERLNEYNVKINWQKCKFFVTEVEYFGHMISFEGIRPTKEKINCPPPTNLKKLVLFRTARILFGIFTE